MNNAEEAPEVQIVALCQKTKRFSETTVRRAFELLSSSKLSFAEQYQTISYGIGCIPQLPANSWHGGSCESHLLNCCQLMAQVYAQTTETQEPRNPGTGYSY